MWVFLVAQTVKNLPAVQETWVQSLGWDDPDEGKGNPHLYSCLENPMDRGAWRATVHGVHCEGMGDRPSGSVPSSHLWPHL